MLGRVQTFSSLSHARSEVKPYPAFLMEMFLPGGKKEINVSAGQKETKGERRSAMMACKKRHDTHSALGNNDCTQQ